MSQEQTDNRGAEADQKSTKKPEDELLKREEIKRRNTQKEEEEKQKREEAKKKEKEQKEKALAAIRKRSEPGFWGKYGQYTGYALLGAVVLFILVSNFSGDRRKLSEINVNDDEFITQHNDSGASFKVGKNSFFEGMTLAKIKEMMNNRITAKKTMPRCNTKVLDSVVPKDAYNFYEQHGNCRFDDSQRHCASSYAEIPISIFRNRYCLLTKGGDFKPSLDFVFRCNTHNSKGCDGGYLVHTLNFLRKGFVDEACWKKNVQDDKGTDCPLQKLKDCEKKYIGTHCALEGEEEIKKEIQAHGPVLSIIAPYRDFLILKDGEYVIEEKSKLEGMTFIKILGWETDREGNGYWLVEPLWSRDWGHNGIGRIKMNSEDSLIEKFAYTLYYEPDEKQKQADDGKSEKTESSGKEDEKEKETPPDFSTFD